MANDKIKGALDRLSELNTLSMANFRDAIIEELCFITDSKIAYFYVSNLAEDQLTLLGYSKSVMESCMIIDHPTVYNVAETGLWGDAVRERCAIITNDYHTTQRPSKRGIPEGHVLVHRHLNLPVFSNDRIVAVVGVGNKATDYTLEDAENVEAFMNGIWCEFQQALWASTW